MKLEVLILIVTAFFIANTYYDGKYMEYLKGLRKYAQMGMFAFAGLSIYLLLKKRPTETKSLFESLGGIIQYMPINKDAKRVFEPFIDMSRRPEYGTPAMIRPKVDNSDILRHKRSVSEARKKYVAASQQWKCKHCKTVLDATYEVDHVQPLHKGGSNEVHNLECLCRSCHAKKTLEDRIF